MKSIELAVISNQYQEDFEPSLTFNEAAQPETLAKICRNFEQRLQAVLVELNTFLKIDYNVREVVGQSAQNLVSESYAETSESHFLAIYLKEIAPIHNYCTQVVAAGLGKYSQLGRLTRKRLPNLTVTEYHRVAKIYNQAAALDYLNEITICFYDSNSRAYTKFINFCRVKADWHNLRAKYHLLAQLPQIDQTELSQCRQELQQQSKVVRKHRASIRRLPQVMNPSPDDGDVRPLRPLRSWKVSEQRYTPLTPSCLQEELNLAG